MLEAPVRQQRKKIEDADGAIAVEIAGAGRWTRNRAWPPKREQRQEINGADLAVMIKVAERLIDRREEHRYGAV